ncbi:ABC transporter substrate-binding protein [Paenibacillus hodogayensis]|uniref:ABC transporter substrate-binding protein n=1 Tax=Paenibacillus hodogayensis TaxID=279208 RepID=A0ABV5W201_9BACL
MNKIHLKWVIPMLLISVAASGCGKTSGGPKEADASQVNEQPVSLVLLNDSGTEQEYVDQVVAEVKKKHPSIELKIYKSEKGSTLDELILAGETPDLILSFNGKLASYRDKDLLYDMTPLIGSRHVDLGRFEPGYIDDVKIASTKNELFGLPVSLAYHALYYNKSLFDKFGVPYPKDGMTWEQTLELARKLTRNESGTQYRGFDIGNMVWASQPLGIAAIDYSTDKATMRTDEWKRVFELMKAFYTIPGNTMTGKAKDDFLKEKTLAMYADLSIASDLEVASKSGLDWDVVQYPSYPEKPNVYGNASVSVIMITKASKHKERAMQVVEAAISDEVQLENSKSGRVSPLQKAEIKQAFGMNKEVFRGKSVQSIFKSKPVKYPIASQYRGKAELIVRTKFSEYVTGAIDVNTALAQADEEINKAVAAEAGK